MWLNSEERSLVTMVMATSKPSFLRCGSLLSNRVVYQYTSHGFIIREGIFIAVTLQQLNVPFSGSSIIGNKRFSDTYLKSEKLLSLITTLQGARSAAGLPWLKHFKFIVM